MADQLATPTDLADYLQQDVDTASATLAIELATGAIQNEVQWRILFETVTNLPILPIAPGGPLQIPTSYLISLALTEAGIALTDQVNYTWTTAGVVERIVNLGPYVYPGTVLYPWRFPLLATFTHGYTTIPQQIRGVCLTVASRLFDNPTGLTREKIGEALEMHAIGDSAFTYAGATLTQPEKDALIPWKVAGGVAVVTW